jgi:hypothetical protein
MKHSNGPALPRIEEKAIDNASPHLIAFVIELLNYSILSLLVRLNKKYLLVKSVTTGVAIILVFIQNALING